MSTRLINESSPDHLVDTLVDTFTNKVSDQSIDHTVNSPPTRTNQWGEETSGLSTQMSKVEIEELRQHLVSAYRCLSSDITFDFKKITDQGDDDKDDYIYLTYNKKDYERSIFSIKVPIPPEIKTMAAQIRYEHTRAR